MGRPVEQNQGPVLGVTNTQLESRLRTLELWRTTEQFAITAVQAAATTLTLRVKSLEDRPAGADYSGQIAALTAAVTKLQATVCPNESRIAAIEADHNAPAS